MAAISKASYTTPLATIGYAKAGWVYTNSEGGASRWRFNASLDSGKTYPALAQPPVLDLLRLSPMV